MKYNWLKYLSKISDNLVSKRTWVFFVASIALWESLITSPEWTIIAGAYLADQVAGNLISRKGSSAPKEEV